MKRIYGNEFEFPIFDTIETIPEPDQDRVLIHMAKVVAQQGIRANGGVAVGDYGDRGWLRNGGLLLRDGSFTEYSSPECDSPRLLVGHEWAGRTVVARGLHRAQTEPAIDVGLSDEGQQLLRQRGALSLAVSSPDGTTWGKHDNFSTVLRLHPYALFRRLHAAMITLVPLVGTGGLKVEDDGRMRFKISQRHPWLKQEVLDGTSRGAQGFFKNSSQAIDHLGGQDPRLFRVQRMDGEPRLNQAAALLDYGVMGLLLSMLECDTLPDVEFVHPLLASAAVSSDLEVTQRYDVRIDGRPARRSVMEIQELYRDASEAYLKDEGPEVLGGSRDARMIMGLWRQAQHSVEHRDDDARRFVDWIAHKIVLDRAVIKAGLQWPLLDPAQDKASRKIVETSQHFKRLDQQPRYDALFNRPNNLITPWEVDALTHQAPRNTRAFLRGWLVAKHGPEIANMDWNSARLNIIEGERAVTYRNDDAFTGTASDIARWMEARPWLSGNARALLDVAESESDARRGHGQETASSLDRILMGA